MAERVNNGILRAIIPILVLADGVLHFSLDFVLFHGTIIGTPSRLGPPRAGAPGRIGPPPGARSNPFILPLNELFLLNFIGAIILAVLFWFSRRWLGERYWVMDVVLVGYEAATFIAWLIFGRPNPMGLGYLSKAIEIVLIIALLVDLRSILRQPGTVARAA